MKNLASLSAREFLALAIFLEEERARVYGDLSYALRETVPPHATVLLRMGQAASARRLRLIDLFHNNFGTHIPLLRRQDVRGLTRLKPRWLVRPMTPGIARKQAETIGREARDFYRRAADLAGDPETHKLLCTILRDETFNGRAMARLDRDASSIQEHSSWLRRFLGRIGVFQ